MTLREFQALRSLAKRRSILKAARAAFLHDGFAGAAAEAIAGAAKVSTATLYRHFASKERLFEAVADAALAELEDCLFTDEPTAAARLEALGFAYATLLSEPQTRAMMRMLIAETGRNGELAARFYASIKARIADIFAAAVVAAADEGVLQPTDDPGHAAGQLQGMIEHATLLRGLILGDAVEPLKPAPAIAASALKTFLARWGRP